MHKRLIPRSLLMAILLISLSTSLALAGGKPLSAQMTGQAVVPSGTGDVNSYGEATLTMNSGKGEVCYEMNLYFFYNNFPPTHAGIYQGAPGANGPEAVDLGAPIPPPRSSLATGCVIADRAIIKAIAMDPPSYYVQIDTEQNPDGAIRGQLH